MSIFQRNLSWIMFGNIAHAILQYLINILCARAFGVSDYGLINYAASIIAFFVAVGTLGYSSIITKNFAEKEEQSGDYLKTALYSRIVFAMLAIVGIQLFLILSGNHDIQLQGVVFCQSLQILFGAADIFVYWFRFKNNAKRVAIVRLVALAISAFWRLGAIYIFDSVTLYVLGVSLETLVFGILLIWFYNREYAAEYQRRASISALKKLLKNSYPFIFSAVLMTVYGQTDKIMLKSYLDNASVGLYSVSLTLAGAISIIPSAIIEGFRPDIMNFKVSDPQRYRQRLQQVYGLVFWVSICYCVFITIFARPIIQLLYGSAYLGAVPSLALIVWYTSFSYFGSVNNIYMVAEGKSRWVQVTTLSGALLNILLNALLIPNFGIVGAAGASLITQVVANFLLLLIVPSLREDFFIILEGITLRGFAQTIKGEKIHKCLLPKMRKTNDRREQ